MAVLPIVQWPDARLTTPCAAAVLGDDLRRLVGDMFDTMYAAPGRGLAAPQLGAMLRVFIMDAGWKSGTPTPRVVVNPEILWRADRMVKGAEGCLSIPDLTADITRAESVRMRWTDLDGQAHDETLTGFEAICAQHEFDHLNGVTMFDHLPPAYRAAADERASQ